MVKKQFIDCIAPSNYNNGQRLEFIARYNLTGKTEKADNRRADKATDCLQYQIKSARATICKGKDIAKHIESERANEFIYITKTLTAYIMSKAEYLDFCEEFGTLTTESPKNGKVEKMRLRYETPTMIEWLNARAE